jgi:hypothetical protein
VTIVFAERPVTESEWLGSEDPCSLREFASVWQSGWGVSRLGLWEPDYQLSHRKQVLFTCALARAFGHHLWRNDWVDSLDLAERAADSPVRRPEPEEIAVVRQAVSDLYGMKHDFQTKAHYLSDQPDFVVEWTERFRAMDRAHCDWIRDLCGNPFRPVVFDRVWRTSTATALAAAIYEERAFDRMPILADALEETGCDNRDILNHCRHDGVHVKGCWVVDRVLGKG